MNKTDSTYKSIGEVAKILNLINKKNGNLSTHTIRFWEKEFKQIRPRILTGKGTVDEGGPWGGGIEINGAGVKVKPLLRDLIIENNTALNGAGIHLYNSASPNIENCIIRNNQAIYPDPSGKWMAVIGGGISADGYDGTMKNVLFAENSSLSGDGVEIGRASCRERV